MLTVNGTLEVECNNCGTRHTIPASDADFDLTSQDERQMGTENGYTWEHSIDCDCEDTIEIECEVWEYPQGAYNDDSANASGGSVIGKFDYNFRQLPDEPDEDLNGTELSPDQISRDGKYPKPNVPGHNSLFFHPLTAHGTNEEREDWGYDLATFCRQNDILYYYFTNDFGKKINVYPNDVIEEWWNKR